MGSVAHTPDNTTPNIPSIHPSIAPRIGGRSGRDDGSLRRARPGSFFCYRPSTYMGTCSFEGAGG